MSLPSKILRLKLIFLQKAYKHNSVIRLAAVDMNGGEAYFQQLAWLLFPVLLTSRSNIALIHPIFV